MESFYALMEQTTRAIHSLISPPKAQKDIRAGRSGNVESELYCFCTFTTCSLPLRERRSR